MKRLHPVIGLLLAATALTACSSTPSAAPSTSTTVLTHPARPAPSTSQHQGLFAAVDDRAAKLALFDASSGKLVRWLTTAESAGTHIDSSAFDRDGRVWITVQRQAECTGDVVGCGPKPDTCAGHVDVLNPSSDTSETVLQVPASQLISDAQPSPDGRFLALLTGRCDKSYFNQHIEVIDLRSKATWTIGAGLTVCHSLSSLSWTPDGRHLAFAYGRSELRPGDHANAGMGAGMCQVPAPPVLDVVAAFTSQSGVGGRTGTAEPGCQIGALTATASGYAAIEGCGGHDGIGRYGRFITYSPALAVLSHSDIGRCINGAEIRTNTTGTAVLGSTYQYCNPPGTTPPHTVTFVADQRGLRTIYDQPNGGMNKFRAISW